MRIHYTGMLILQWLTPCISHPGLPCHEIHVCGESSAIDVVQRLVSSCNDEMEVKIASVIMCVEILVSSFIHHQEY